VRGVVFPRIEERREIDMKPLNVSDVILPPADADAALVHAHHKRLSYPWNNWGRRLPYTDLLSSGAALVDAWADPASITPQTGTISLWLRAEVWRHPDGTTYRTVLDTQGTVVVPPLTCCPRPHDLPEGISLPLSLVPPALTAFAEVLP
jgi:hypothetical protein